MLQIVLQIDSEPGRVVLAFQYEAQRCTGSRTTFGPLLTLPLQLIHNHPPVNRATPLLIGGVLRLSQEHDGIAIDSRAWLFNQTGISINLSDGQVERIEQKRGGGQPIFELALSGLALVDGVTTVISSMSNALYAVPRDEWIRVLASMEYGLRRLIELPPPPGGIGGLWDTVLERIAAGTARLASGDAAVAIAEARVAMERLLEAIGEVIETPRIKGGVKPFVDTTIAELGRRQGTSRNSLYAVIAKAIVLGFELFAFASDPPHIGFDAAARRDAECALGLVTTIYAYAARLPDVHRAMGNSCPEPGG